MPRKFSCHLLCIYTTSCETKSHLFFSPFIYQVVVTFILKEGKSFVITFFSKWSHNTSSFLPFLITFLSFLTLTIDYTEEKKSFWLNLQFLHQWPTLLDFSLSIYFFSLHVLSNTL